MAGKVKRFVLDANTYITVFINGEADWLQRYVVQNRLEIFTDVHLMTELERVLRYKKLKRFLPLDTHLYLQFVRLISTLAVADDNGVRSPDPDDNYLYNLALTVHAKLLVTGEKALLEWDASPVETISLTEFKQTF